MRMFAFVKVNFTEDGKIAVMDSGGGMKIALLGSTLRFTAQRGALHDSFMIEPGESQTGLIALRTMMNVARNSWEKNYCAFVYFDRSFPLPFDLRETWIPRHRRTGQIIDNQYIEVRAGNAVYSNVPDGCPDGAKPRHFVDDPDLLCRFLNGEVDESALEQAVTRCSVERSELDRLKAVVISLQEELTFLSRKYRNVLRGLDSWRLDAARFLEVRRLLVHTDLGDYKGNFWWPFITKAKLVALLQKMDHAWKPDNWVTLEELETDL